MSQPTIQDILSSIEQPSHYLGTEPNVIRKDHRQIELSIALAFPDLYNIGTSHFGMQILYHVLNQRSDTVAERVFAPGIDMQAHLKSLGQPLTTLESGRPLKDFDIIGFSLLYELNYTNLLGMLDLGRIPFLGKQRDEMAPLIIAGGPCTCNPEPVADIFDAMVIGDGETVIIEMVEKWKLWQKKRYKRKRALLELWSEIKGVYIPSFFVPVSDESGKQLLQPAYSHYVRIERSVVKDLNQAAFPEKPIVPFGRPVHDRLRLEVARGCTRGCRFCQAGMIYRPVRERSPETLLRLADLSLSHTGYEDISLLSLSTGDYGCIETLMQALMDRCAADHVAVSLPSLRAGTLTPELMNLIRKVRKTGFTIAPEAGSQRLRNVINKNISEKEIADTVEDAFSLGWQVVKLYFMIGLPTEKEKDLQAIFDLVQRLRKIKKPDRRKGKINVSVAAFIPKPHTPFQWTGQISLEGAQQKMRLLREKLKGPGIQFKWQPPEVSQIEGLWARGDRRLVHLLIKAYHLGCRFDGWSDHFKHNTWQKACLAENVSIESYTERQREFSEQLPWDHIDMGVSKEYLQSEYRKALSGVLTEDCRVGTCNQCGTCDFEHIAPMFYSVCALDPQEKQPTDDPNPPLFRQFLVTFSKNGPARFFGHLEMANIFVRAFRRTNVQLKYSEGYHPKPKLAFLDALPVGMESLQEYLVITVSGESVPENIVSRLNSILPEGLRIADCCSLPSAIKKADAFVSTYRVVSEVGLFEEKQMGMNMKRSEWIINRTNRKGKTRQIDLKKAVLGFERRSSTELQMTLKSTSSQTVRPGEVVAYIFDMPLHNLRQLRTIKIYNRFEPLVGGRG